MARPTDYRDDFPEQLTELMKEGKKGCHLFAHFGISRRTFYLWCKKHPEFHTAYEQGWELCEKWWEDHGLKMMLAGSEDGFKPWIAFMNKNFNWSNRDKSDQAGGAQINIGNINVFQEQSKEELLTYILKSVNELQIVDAQFEIQDVQELEILNEFKQ